MRALERSAIIGLCALAAVTVLGFAGALHWRFDLLSHFRLHYALAAALALAVLAVRRRERWALVATLLLATNAALVLPLWLATPAAPDPSSRPLSVVLYNANSANPRTADIATHLADANADIVVLVEATPAMVAALGAALPDHRSLARPHEQPLGIAVFSRLPLESARALDLGGSVPQLEVVVRHAGSRIALLAIHPLAPVNAELARARDALLAAVGDWSERQHDPHIVVGDFNATPWSRPMRTLLAGGRLVNSQMGHGMHGTWPRGAAWLTIPIDHLLHSRQLTTTRRSTGSFVGSDHRSVHVTLRAALGHAPRAARTAYR